MQPRIACINLTGVPRSAQLLKINGFDTTDYDEDPSVASTTLSAGGYDWVIVYYPREWVSGNSFWVMLRITLASNTKGPVSASFAGRLMDPRYGRLGPRQLRPPVSAMLDKGQAVDFFVVSRPELFRSGYVHDDSFLLELKITVGGEPKGATTAAGAAAAPSSDLHRHFGELWRSQRGTDVTFVVSGEHIAAHRCVLAARSLVFGAELFGDMKETASPRVEIEDMEPEVFRALMHFIYTDTSPEKLDGQGVEAKAMAQHLLATADRYGMERLKLICEDKVCGDVSVDTAATHLVLAEQHGCPRLKARCMEFMVACPANVLAIVKTDGYKYLMASCPSVLTDLLVAVVKRCK